MRSGIEKLIMHRRKLTLLIIVLTLLFPISAISKTKVYYVAGSSSTASANQKAIIDNITNGLKAGLGDMWVSKMNPNTWSDDDSRKSLLEEQPVDYVLILDEWRENEAKKSFEMKFKLLSVKNGHFTTNIWWLNNDYRFGLYSGQPIEKTFNKFIDEVCTDIDLYIKSSDDLSERKFRPRIKINTFELDLADVDNKEFIMWLNDELNSKYALDNQKYVFYYSSKKSKIYPETSAYKINGIISKSANNGGDLMKIELVIEFPGDESEIKAELKKDFKNDERGKKNLVENIDNTFNDNL